MNALSGSCSSMLNLAGHLACILANPTTSTPDRYAARRVLVPQSSQAELHLLKTVVQRHLKASQGSGIKARVLG